MERHFSSQMQIRQKHRYEDDTSKFKGECLPTLGGYQGLMVSNVTGNITRLADSVILDIGESSSSSSSNSNLDQISEGASTEPTHCNDWEVRMLAAELDRRENKRHRAASANLAEIGKYENLLRRRRKGSDTEYSETEFSETEGDIPLRPRAASLDQFNLRHDRSKSIFKTKSTDKDKDRL